MRAGGAVGELLAGMLIADFSRTGAYIMAATALFVALILSTQFSFSSVLGAVGGRLGARLRALQTAWAHYRETRRKERMRREVIRKHTRPPRASPRPGLPRIRKVKAGETPAAEKGPADDGRLDLRRPPAQRPRGPRTRPARPEGPARSISCGQDRRTEPGGAPASKTRPRRRRHSRDAEREPRGPGRPRAAPDHHSRRRPRSSGGVDNDRLLERGRILQAKCGEFGVMGAVKEIHPGPVVTTYEFKPDAGVKYSKIVGLADDLALALEAESIRIDRVSGKGNVGIEIPNEQAGDDLPPRAARVRGLPPGLRPPHPRPGQGGQRRRCA